MIGQQEPTWRVYLTEWLVVWTSDADGPEGRAECRRYFTDKYRGRVRDEDWREVPGIAGCLSRPDAQSYCLELQLPNLRGEFKDHNDARAAASDLMDGYGGGPCDLVLRGSAEEKALLDYGKKMLPGAGTTEG